MKTSFPRFVLIPALSMFAFLSGAGSFASSFSECQSSLVRNEHGGYACSLQPAGAGRTPSQISQTARRVALADCELRFSGASDGAQLHLAKGLGAKPRPMSLGEANRCLAQARAFGELE